MRILFLIVRWMLALIALGASGVLLYTVYKERDGIGVGSEVLVVSVLVTWAMTLIFPKFFEN